MPPPLPQIVSLQDGLLTRSQAIEAGIGLAAIRHAIRPHGPWQRVLTGVYATFTGQLHDIHRLRAATLAAGPGSMITGAWACHLAGLHYGPPPDARVDVLIDERQDRGSIGYVRTIRTSRLPHSRKWIDDERSSDIPLAMISQRESPMPGTLEIAPAARAVVDSVVRLDRLPPSWQPTCALLGGCPGCRRDGGHASLARRNVRALMCEVVQRRQAMVSVLQEELDAAPRRGSALARAAMTDIVAGCRSAPECELRDLVMSSRILPEPRWNLSLPGLRGVIPDACWPEARLVVEVDSRSFHGFGDAPERTERRRARYAEHGWRVLPISPAQLRSEPQGVRRMIEKAYRAGLRAGR